MYQYSILTRKIKNYIKRQAKEHDGFRRFAITQAQRVHQIDMRMRLGILHDADAQQRMHDREQKALEQKKLKEETPVVRTEAEQKKYDEEKARAEKEGAEKKKEDKAPKVKIRPLSEAKAIELGANFFSEAFIFAVAAGLLVWDSWRSRRKESARRDDVADRLSDLEAELARLRSKHEPNLESSQVVGQPEKTAAWWNPAGWWSRTEPNEVRSEPQKAQSIPGNVPTPQPQEAIKPASASRPAAATVAAPIAKPEAAKPEPKAETVKVTVERVDSVNASQKER